MIRSNDLNARGEELIAKFPTRFSLTAEEAMARSSIEISGSSRVWVMPCGAFTWTDGDGFWIHPEYGNRFQLDDCRRGRVEVTSKLLIPPDYPRCELTVERRGRDTDGAEDERVRAIMLR